MKIRITATCVIDANEHRGHLLDLLKLNPELAFERLLFASEGKHETTEFKLTVEPVQQA